MPDLKKARLLMQAGFWNRKAGSFDAIYSGRKSRLGRLLDATLRRDMYERFEFAMRNCEPIAGRTFLDLGCGSGRYSIELAKRGARRVIGIDVAERMLDLARKLAEETGTDGVCSWVHGDITAYESEPVDVSLAIGLFDYLEDPVPVLERLARCTTTKLILSFPRSNTWRAPVRRARLAMQGCQVFFYSKRDVDELIASVDLEVRILETVGKLYCAVAGPAGVS